jgi:paraquat-inducible protein A
MNRYILLCLHIISLILLGFGWIKDVLQIDISVHFMVDINLFNEKRSVFGMLEKLWNAGNYWPFLLIFLFGIIVPLVKSGIIFYIILAKNPNIKWRHFVSAISKWAMADVFVIGIFVAFLGANAMENTKAVLLPGFYYFSGYVLLSAAIAFLLGKMLNNSATNNA